MPYQVIGNVPGSTSDSFIRGNGTNNGATLSPSDRTANDGFAENRNEELMLQVTLGKETQITLPPSLRIQLAAVGDTTKLEGRVLSPVYLEESVSDVYYRKSPEKTKTIIKGQRKVDFGEFLAPSASRRPLHFERVAFDALKIEIALYRERMHALSAPLTYLT